MLEASNPPWCIVQRSPVRLRIFAAAANALVWSESSAGAAVTRMSARSRSQGIGTPYCFDTSSRMSGRSSPGVAGLPHWRAARSISASRSGTSPATNMPWRASLTSSAMSIPIGHTSVQRPHIVHES